MRLPLKDKEKSSNKIVIINKFHSELQEAFENAVKRNIKAFNTKVMLADFSVIEITSFDPNYIVKLFENFEKEIKTNLPRWKAVPVQSTKSDDLRRIYVQLSLEIEKYYIYIYLGIQFHSLLYYQVDKEVINMTKQIRNAEKLFDETKSEITVEGDRILKEELEKLGYKEIDNAQLFEELFTKSQLSEKLIEKAYQVEQNYPSIKENEIHLANLKKKLEKYIIEAYQINTASLDQNKMLQGEEGIVIYIDFETIKNKKTKEKSSVINFEKISDEILNEIKKEFTGITQILSRLQF
ncbi:conserved protein of unknown function [Candidatus Nitrosocosmicus franklandus]|uniref:Uncharacterized protein n=2 Tax=Candidatus Nitrosocosmicus franklandianus TaxID=1798806 RepID=A0A484I8E2_9ARCH|nr:conserved protein of unknown function [Candidatus Nitrosocosmicus franklandus]